MKNCILICTNGDDIDLVKCLINSICDNYKSHPNIIIFTDSNIEFDVPCDVIVVPKLKSSKDVNFGRNRIHNEVFHNATILRFRAIDLLIKTYDKILYLDTDVIVLEDLSELFSTVHFFNAALDYNYSNGTISAPHINSTYFNAGVMVISKELYSKCNIESLYEDYELAETYELLDQDYLNMLVDANILDQCYNYTSFDKLPKNTKILHLCCFKPWLSPNRFKLPILSALIKYLPKQSPKYQPIYDRVKELQLIDAVSRIDAVTRII